MACMSIWWSFIQVNLHLRTWQVVASNFFGTSLKLGVQRGSFVSLFQPFTTLGTFIGAVVSNAFHLEVGKHSYQFQLLILYAVPTWLAIVVWLIPESPRWLVVQGLQCTSSTSSVQKIY